VLIAGGGIVRIRRQFQDLAKEMRDLCRMVQIDDVKILHDEGLVRTDQELGVEA
jgi:predicted MarR family transcription regulator